MHKEKLIKFCCLQYYKLHIIYNIIYNIKYNKQFYIIITKMNTLQ